MGTNTPKPNRIDQNAADQSLIDGFNENAAAITNVVVGGVPHATKDIVATLQSRIDSSKAVLSTRATWQTAVKADKTLRDTTKTFVSAVKQSLLVSFAGHLDTLADFGLTERAKPVRTPEEKLAAANKAKATRAARHTMGSKQKADIKGTVTPTAPLTAAPPAPAPTPTTPATPPAAPVTPPASPVSPVTPAGSTTSPGTPATPPVHGT